MNHAQSYCRSIKRMYNSGGLIPAEYQQVEYLQSAGEQTIHTGVNASAALLVTVNFSLANTFTYANGSFIFGAFYGSGGGNNTCVYSFALPGASTGRVPALGNFTNISIANVSSGSHTIEYCFGSQVVDGVKYGSYSGAASTQREIYLFGRNAWSTSNGGVTDKTAGLIIYRAQLGTSTDATQYRDLYPCYRKSDNVTGMYDLINSEFIPYTGTANFITGSNI